MLVGTTKELLGWGCGGGRVTYRGTAGLVLDFWPDAFADGRTTVWSSSLRRDFSWATILRVAMFDGLAVVLRGRCLSWGMRDCGWECWMSLDNGMLGGLVLERDGTRSHSFLRAT